MDQQELKNVRHMLPRLWAWVEEQLIIAAS